MNYDYAAMAKYLETGHLTDPSRPSVFEKDAATLRQLGIILIPLAIF